MTTDLVTDTVEQLHRASVRQFVNPYDYIEWPDVVDPRQWFTSPELISIFDTGTWHGLDEETRRRLSFFEAVNFFSLNIFGERQQMEGLAARLYGAENQRLTKYLHHFLDEENKHNILFGTFCLTYAGKVYPHVRLEFGRDYEDGEEDFLFFARILIFEDIADRHNLVMAKDQRLAPVAREINHLHHLEESRHLRFGKVVVTDLWNRYAPQWSDATVAGVRRHLGDFLLASWRQYYNPAVYRDAGLGTAAACFALREQALEDPRRQAHRRQMSSHCLRFLRDAGILTEEVAL